MNLPADMNRTFPDNVKFRKNADPCLQKTLYNILLAYGRHNEGVGYCQVSPWISARGSPGQEGEHAQHPGCCRDGLQLHTVFHSTPELLSLSPTCRALTLECFPSGEAVRHQT